MFLYPLFQMFYLIHVFNLLSRFWTQELPTRRIIRFNPYASINGVFVNNSFNCSTINTLFYIGNIIIIDTIMFFKIIFSFTKFGGY